MSKNKFNISLIREEFVKLSQLLSFKFEELQKVRNRISQIKLTNIGFNYGLDDIELKTLILKEQELHNEIRFGIDIQRKLISNYQKEIRKFLNEAQNKNKHYNDGKNESSNADKLDLALQLTLDGTLELNETNPIFNSIPHLKLLLKTYEDNEDYENCTLITNRINNLN